MTMTAKEFMEMNKSSARKGLEENKTRQRSAGFVISAAILHFIEAYEDVVGYEADVQEAIERTDEQ